MAANLNHVDKSVGLRLCDMRTASGLSQEQLAERLRCDPEDVAAYESGTKRIRAGRMLQIAKAIGERPAEFFRFSEKPERGASEDDKRSSERAGGYTDIVEEGLALHKAFVNIKQQEIRMIVIALAIEYGNMKGQD